MTPKTDSVAVLRERQINELVKLADDVWNGRQRMDCIRDAVAEILDMSARDEAGAVGSAYDGLCPCCGEIECEEPATPPASGEDGAVAWAADDFYSNHPLPVLHDDPAINMELLVQALTNRLDTARQALAAVAAMQVVQPALQQIKANAAWAMSETDPRRLLPRSVTYNATPPAASGGAEGIAASIDQMLDSTFALCNEPLPADCYEVLYRAAALIRRLAAVAPAGMDGGALKLDTDSQVFFYEQDFYVLSNFSSFRVHHWGLPFDTSEAAYHWMKFADTAPEIAEEIRLAPSAHEAFKIAERNKGRRRPDWDDIKLNVMRGILRSKVQQHEYVRRKLLATGDRELVENSWRDDYWGWGPNRDGHNMLGKLWMEIRAAMQAAAPTPPATAGEE